MNWEQIKEGLYAAVAFAFLVQFWALKGQWKQFITNHWPTFIKQFTKLDEKVDKHGERIAHLEGKE